MNWDNKQTPFSTNYSLDSTIERYNAAKQKLTQEKSNSMTNQRFSNMESNLSMSINSNNDNIKQQSNLASRTWLVAQMIAEEAKRHWKDYSTMLDWEIVSTYKSKNPERANIIDSFINSDQDPYELKRIMWWSNTPAVQQEAEDDRSFIDKAKDSLAWPLVRGVAGLTQWILWAWKWLANIPNRMNEFDEYTEENVPAVYDENWKPHHAEWTTAYDKLKWGAKLVATVWDMIGDVSWGALEWVFKGTTTAEERQALQSQVVDKIANTEVAQNVLNWYNWLGEEAKFWVWVAEWLSNIPLSAWGGKVAESAVKATAKKLNNEVINKWVKEVVDPAIEWIQTAAKTVKTRNAINNLEKNTAKAEATAWRIVQWDIKAQWEAVQALKEIDTEWVKTYSELWKRIGSKKEEVAKKVDNILAQDKTKYDGKTSKQVDLGEWRYQTIGETPAQDAIDDLKALYEKIWDKAELVKIEDAERRLNTEWLSKLELNNLAKQHGNEFRRKAFNEDWSPKYSDIWTKFETNRSNLKEYVRELVPDDATKDLDRLYHNLADTDYYVNKMTEKVNHLTQTIKERNLFEKIWAKAGDILNTVSWWSIKSFVTKFIPSNVGNKVNNSIDMEKELSKMLKRLDTYQKRIDMANTDEAKEIIKEMKNELKLD